MPDPSPETRPRISCLHQGDRLDLVTQLESATWSVLTLDGRDVVDKASLLARVEADLPMPEGLHPHNWDALSDCLWGTVTSLDADRVALIWDRTDVLAGADLEALITAATIIERLVDDVASPPPGSRRSVILRAFLLGEGPMFHSLAGPL